MYTNKPVFTPETPSFGSQPYARQFPQGLWTSGICDFYLDPQICIQTTFCPCITFGQNAEIISRGSQERVKWNVIYGAMVLCGWVFGFTNRSRLREHFALPEEPCGDCWTHLFCAPCALCQEARELKSRGAHPTLGWQENVEKWAAEKTTPPIVVPGMAR